MSRSSRAPTVRAIILAGLPAILAIGVFGVIYGAAAKPLLGPEMTILASVVVFSGALQFATVGLIASGGAATALLATAFTLNLRHVVLGAVLRPRLGRSRLRRAAQAWFLVDETFGFAVAAGSDPDLSPEERTAVSERTLMATGICCYSAWVVGTVLGVVGAGLPGLEGVAAAVFPILFIGLAALAARSRGIVARAFAAVVVTALIAVMAPDLRALAPVVAGVVVALPGDRSPRMGKAP